MGKKVKRTEALLALAKAVENLAAAIDRNTAIVAAAQPRKADDNAAS